MDLNDARMIMTVVALLTFVGIVAWAYSGRREKDFEKAARMALEEEYEPTAHDRSGK